MPGAGDSIAMRFPTTFTAVLAAVAPLALLAQDGPRRLIGAPTTIDSPGSYVLRGDINFSASTGIGIAITASGVTLDLNGFEIRGQGAGIRITGASGVAVSNGAIAASSIGITVSNSNNVTLRGLRVRGMNQPPPETGLMIVQSKNVVVEENAFYGVGLGIFVRGGMSSGNRIARNTITAASNGVLGICYNPASDDPMGPAGDLIQDNLIQGFGVSIQMSGLSRYNIMRGNALVFKESGIESRNPTNVAEGNTEVKVE